MSKQRAHARAQRQAEAAARAEAARTRQAAEAAARAKRERRAARWRHLRLWQSGGPQARATRERIGVVGALMLLALVAVFVVTRSVTATVGTGLILLVGAPVLIMVLFDRRRR